MNFICKNSWPDNYFYPVGFLCVCNESGTVVIRRKLSVSQEKHIFS